MLVVVLVAGCAAPPKPTGNANPSGFEAYAVRVEPTVLDLERIGQFAIMSCPNTLGPSSTLCPSSILMGEQSWIIDVSDDQAVFWRLNATLTGSSTSPRLHLDLVAIHEVLCDPSSTNATAGQPNRQADAGEMCSEDRPLASADGASPLVLQGEYFSQSGEHIARLTARFDQASLVEDAAKDRSVELTGSLAAFHPVGDPIPLNLTEPQSDSTPQR